MKPVPTSNIYAADDEQTPRFEPFAKTHTSDVLWHHVRVRVNSFTLQEHPALMPLSFHDWSIGEEISSNNVVALSWSSTGLNAQKRAALGVLTSNLLLSIWESTSKPQMASSWTRTIIVNRALEQYFSALNDTKENKLLRRRSRIRAFAWSPVIDRHGSNAAGQVLAVTNDCNEVVILRVQLVADVLLPNSGKDQQVTVVTHLRTSSTDEDNLSRRGQTFEGVVTNQTFQSHVSWSPWRKAGNDVSTCFLLHASASHVYFCRVSASYTSRVGAVEMTFGEQSLLPVSIRQNALIKWLPELPDSGKPSFVTVTEESVVCVSFDFEDTVSISTLTTSSISDHWDMVSGITFTYFPHSAVHFAFHLSTASATETTLPLSGLTVNGADGLGRVWKQQFADKMAAFSAEHELYGHVLAKVWGLTASPFGFIIATCTSFHPNNQIAYIIPSDQFCLVDLSDLHESEESIFRILTHADTHGPTGSASYAAIHLLSCQLTACSYQRRIFDFLHKEMATSSVFSE